MMKTIARFTEKGEHVRSQGGCEMILFSMIKAAVDKGCEEEACPGEADGREVMRV
jgi:hypothetical protein